MDKESLRRLLGQGLSVERIPKRFGKDPSTVSYQMRKHGLEAPNREKHAAKGGIGRERLEALADAGMKNRRDRGRGRARATEPCGTFLDAEVRVTNAEWAWKARELPSGGRDWRDDTSRYSCRCVGLSQYTLIRGNSIGRVFGC